MCVNFGRGGAVKVLQEAANSKNKNKIDVDGGIGPATLKAIQNISLDRVRAYRVLRFANIVIQKPKQEKFWLGWFRRALEVQNYDRTKELYSTKLCGLGIEENGYIVNKKQNNE